MAACDFGMPVAQGRQSEALIRLRISIVADAKQGQLQEAHDGGQYLLARKTVASKIGIDPRPDQRQHPGEDEHFCWIWIRP
jgi:hypothetical protein